MDDFWPTIHGNKSVEFSRLTKVGFDFTTSFFNLLVFLVDVLLGNVSAYLPGIHKPNFECPDHITMDADPPIVRNVPVRNGISLFFCSRPRPNSCTVSRDEANDEAPMDSE